MLRLGVIAIARPTFDCEFAQATANLAVANLRSAGIDVVGDSALAKDLDSVVASSERLSHASIDGLVVMQASFADSSLVVRVANADLPLVIWAFPEERVGGRLRLNSFCGLNLACYTLTSLGLTTRWLYARADDPHAADEIATRLHEKPTPPRFGAVEAIEAFDAVVVSRATTVRDRLRATTVGRVGQEPDGFEPCRYDPVASRELLGLGVDEVSLAKLFKTAERATVDDIAVVRGQAESSLRGLPDVDQTALDRSLRLKVGLRSLTADRQWAGVAARCWPETFTEFGGAACAPMAMLTAEGTPAACEADVYGAVTSLVLKWLGDQPAFVADLVHLDATDDTGVLWHCGLAPITMADPESTPTATVHSNRNKPLLHEFPLKPGRVTVARVSQSRGRHRLVVGGGEMVRRPLAFSGTAGVVRFDRPVAEVMETVLSEGLEHHYGVVYADVREELRALAALLGFPVVEL